MIVFDPVRVLAAAKGSSSFITAARFWTGKLVLKMGEEAYVLEVADGNAVDFRRDDELLNAPVQLEGADMAISGSAVTWEKFLSEVPPPGFQNPLFIVGDADFTVEGNQVTAIGPFFWPVQHFLDLLRQIRNDSPAPAMLPVVDRDFDDAVGRYMYVDIQGVQYRIYYEEAGSGSIPMVLQHTAGADGRQWRHVLEDPDYQKLYRMISYDLPFHGKSLPPTSHPWWEEPYRLTRSFLMDALIAICQKLNLDRPVYMGCSVGGMLAPDLAYYHPDKFRAVISLNGSLAADEAQRSMVLTAHHLGSSPQVSNHWIMSLIHAAAVPTSPVPYRRETMWVYGQGAPRLNEGDCYYYSIDYDLTAEQAAEIDTSVVGVYLITGEYDPLAIDGGSKLLADAIKGCHFQVVPDLGHFGPSDHPEAAKKALLPVLREIAANAVAAESQGSKAPVL